MLSDARNVVGNSGEICCDKVRRMYYHMREILSAIQLKHVVKDEVQRMCFHMREMLLAIQVICVVSDETQKLCFQDVRNVVGNSVEIYCDIARRMYFHKREMLSAI